MREFPSARHGNAISCAAVFLITLILGSCGVGSKGSFYDPEGPVLSWTPQNPLVGDLVDVTAEIPGDVWEDHKEGLVLQDGEGKDMPPLIKTFHEKGISLSWRFRASRPGIWTWGKDHRVLWSVPAAAKEGQDLVRFSGQELWSLKADPSPLPAAPGAGQGGPMPGGTSQGGALPGLPGGSGQGQPVSPASQAPGGQDLPGGGGSI